MSLIVAYCVTIFAHVYYALDTFGAMPFSIFGFEFDCIAKAQKTYILLQADRYDQVCRALLRCVGHAPKYVAADLLTLTSHKLINKSIIEEEINPVA